MTTEAQLPATSRFTVRTGAWDGAGGMGSRILRTRGCRKPPLQPGSFNREIKKRVIRQSRRAEATNFFHQN